MDRLSDAVSIILAISSGKLHGHSMLQRVIIEPAKRRVSLGLLNVFQIQIKFCMVRVRSPLKRYGHSMLQRVIIEARQTPRVAGAAECVSDPNKVLCGQGALAIETIGNHGSPFRCCEH